MELTKKEAIMLRKLYLLPSKGLFKKIICYGDIISHMQKNEEISVGYIENRVSHFIKEGFLIFHKKEERNKYYTVNKEMILEELEKDDIYRMDEEIIRDQFSVMLK